jgi:hypothetical protein
LALLVSAAASAVRAVRPANVSAAIASRELRFVRPVARSFPVNLFTFESPYIVVELLPNFQTGSA